jgi:hypothetical protein
MDDAEFHDSMIEAYKKQHRAKAEAKPANVDYEGWKNRHRISAKLHGCVYADLMAFCRKHGMSVNSASNFILSTFFKTNV